MPPTDPRPETATDRISLAFLARRWRRRSDAYPELTHIGVHCCPAHVGNQDAGTGCFDMTPAEQARAHGLPPYLFVVVARRNLVDTVRNRW